MWNGSTYTWFKWACLQRPSHAQINMAYLKRLKKEYMELKKNPPPGVALDDSVLENNITKFVKLVVLVLLKLLFLSQSF